MLFPLVALLGVSGIVVGILNSYDHFTVPALSPVFWNVAIIAGLALGVPHASGDSAKLYIYAASILVAHARSRCFLPMPWLRGRDGRLQLVLDWRDPAVGRVFKLMLPVTLGLGLINVNAVIDTFFASRFIDSDLAPTAINKAFLVYMLPQGMFSVAVATVLFPSLVTLLGARRHGRLPPHGLDGPAPDRVPAHPRRRRSAPCSRSRSSGSSSSAARCSRRRRRSSPAHSPRSAPGSCSTARC